MQESICRYILQWVEENIDTGHNIADLTKSVGYSRKTIETWFFQFSGMSLGYYLMRRKMTRAAVILKLTSLPVTEIALLLHYSCNQNFARAFRRFSGKTPAQYRMGEGWDCTVLQSSLLHSDHKVTDVRLCELRDRYLSGVSYLRKDSYLYNGKNTFTGLVQKEVVRLILSGVNDVFLSGRSSTSDCVKENREGQLENRIILGQITETDAENARLILGGTFLSYRFTCSWEEYYSYTNGLFIQMMSEHKFHFSGGDCYVHFTGRPEDINRQVSCEMFIPVV